MAGGGSHTTSTVHQSNLPEYARPYYDYLMQHGVSESKRPYQPYQGQRIADMDPSTISGLNSAQKFGQSGMGDLPYAQQMAKNIGAKAFGMSGYKSGFQAGQFDQAQAAKYMSPYMDDVTNFSKMAATKDAMNEQVYRDSEAAKAGAFGGSRAAVQKQMASNSLMDRLTGITVQGRQAAFENAQEQFERDRAARAQSETFRQGAQKMNLDALNLGQGSASQMAEMQKMNDQMRLQRIQSLLGVGQAKQDFKQKKLDMAYDDFINQRDARRQNLQFYSSLLQGVPVSANQNVVTKDNSGNPLNGIAGSLTGLQALYALSKQG